jgi:uncharacterized peroxidase-related enzyme
MAFIGTIADDEATAAVAELYESDRAHSGYVANSTRLFAHRPAVYAAWEELKSAITSSMDARRYELVTLAAARRLRSSYCALAHGRVLAEHFYDPTVVQDLATNHRSAGLDATDVAIMDLADKVAGDAASVTEADIEPLREAGLSDAEIFDVVAAAAVRCFFSKTLDALGGQADPAFAELEPGLRDALTVGRPVEER